MALTSSLIGNTNTTVYTSTVSGSQTGNAITSMIICNYTSGTSSWVTLYAVPNNAGSVGTASNTIVAVAQTASVLSITLSTLPT